jgi:hypothetical protein
MITWWSRLVAFVRHRLGRSRGEQSVARELESYLQLEIDAKIESGLSPEAARRAALAEFGGIGRVREGVRDARAGAWVDAATQDVRAALRTIRRTPAFSCAIVVSLTIGLAAVLAAMGLLNGMFFRPPSGVPSPGDLVRVDIEWRGGRLTQEETQRLTQGVEGLSRIAAEGSAEVAINIAAAESVRASLVSDNFFDVLGVGIAPGRPFGSKHPAEVAVIAHRLWMRTSRATRRSSGGPCGSPTPSCRSSASRPRDSRA